MCKLKMRNKYFQNLEQPPLKLYFFYLLLGTTIPSFLFFFLFFFYEGHLYFGSTNFIPNCIVRYLSFNIFFFIVIQSRWNIKKIVFMAILSKKMLREVHCLERKVVYTYECYLLHFWAP